MLLSFRQGIVQHEPSGFLSVTPTDVTLVVVDTPTIVTLANGSKDYLHVERESVSQAWGPITPGVDQWLYWDINTSTGLRTFGITLTNPVFQPDEPLTPASDLHWFDTTTGIMKVWSGVRWAERIRVFACKLANGSVPISMSPLAPSFIGSQVGYDTSSYAGQIMFDSVNGKVLKTGTKFVTTEDVLSVQALTKSDVKFASVVIPAEAQQTLSAYTIVKFSDFGKIIHADAFVANQTLPFGIIQQSCLPGDAITVLVDGAITNPLWDWSAAGINALLYCDDSGVLTPTAQIPGQLPIAIVIDTKTILLGSPRNLNTGDMFTAPTSIDELTDVTLAVPVADQVLTFDGIEWVNADLPPTPLLGELSDVEITTPSSGEVLTFNGLEWSNASLPPIPDPVVTLDGLTDVTVATPSSGDVLTFTGTIWENTPLALPQADRIVSGDTSLVVNGTADSCVFTVSNVDPVTITPTVATFTTDEQGAWSMSVGEGPDLLISESWGASVIHDNAGNIIAVGGISQQVTFDDYIVVIKYTPTGTMLWSKSFQVSGFDMPGETVAVDSDDNIYVGTGGYDSSVIKLSTTGSLLWHVELTMGAQQNYITSIVVKQNNNPVIMMLTNGAWGVPVIELDADTGAQVWLFSAFHDGAELVSGSQMSTDGTNIYYVAAPPSGISVIPRTIKLSDAGAHVWTTIIDYTPGLTIYGCIVDSGYVYVAGSRTISPGVVDNSQLVVAKLDASDGSTVWSYSYTGPADTDVYCEHLAVDPSAPGVLYVGGTHSIPFNENRLICAIDMATGDVDWSVSLDIEQLGNYSWYWYGRDVISANAGNVVTVGYNVLLSGYDEWTITSIPAATPTFVSGTSSSQSLTLIKTVTSNTITSGQTTDQYVGGQYGGLIHTPYNVYTITDNSPTIISDTIFGTAAQYLVDIVGSIALTTDVVLAGSSGGTGQVITSTPNGARWSTIDTASPLEVRHAGGQHDITIATSSLENGFTGIPTGAIPRENISLGADALRSGTTGERNIAIGSTALKYNEAGSDNVAVGVSSQSGTAPNSNLSYNNTSVGSYALRAIAGGHDNVAIGPDSLRSTTVGSTNVGIGPDTLYTNTNGNDNTAIGNQSLYSNTSGIGNTAIGVGAVKNNTTGEYNIGVGPLALFWSTSGSHNIAQGNNSLYTNTTGSGNVAIGYNASFNNTIGFNNVAVGYEALKGNVSGNYNVAVGGRALLGNTSGGNNIALGQNTLQSNTSGNTNIAIGLAAMTNNTTGTLNVAAGNDALTFNTTGYNNVAIGYQTSYLNATGFTNVAIGNRALYSNTTGNDNVAVGNSAGFASTGNYNVFLGYNAGYNETGSNKLYIANSNTATPLVLGDFSASTLTVNGRFRAKTAYSDTTVLSIVTGNVAVDASLSNNFELTANTNFTLQNPTNLVKGMIINFEIIQDATGGRLITYGTMYKFPKTADKNLSGPIGARDFLSCYYNGTNLLCSINKEYV